MNSIFEPVLVDQFALSGKIGAGGMGDVWGGTHVHSGVGVAVKVLTGRHARTPRYIASFRREVQASAGLDHRSIVVVYEHGEIEAAAEKASGGVLVAGAPYLVMELADTTLKRWLSGRAVSWSQIEGVLLSLLDALAHAHARGVVHRDIKPGNVLGFGEGDTIAWKLTDFGIAHPLEEVRQGSVEDSLGTPRYMAPEQLRGTWRDYGPWTDLYALGCMAYFLVCGEFPFGGETAAELAIAHITKPAPDLKPMCAVPSELDGWIKRLLAKSPERRFRRAADAAMALLELTPPELERTSSSTTEVSVNLGARGPVGLHTLDGLLDATTPSAVQLDLGEASDTVAVSLSQSTSGLSPVLRRTGGRIKVPHTWRTDGPERGRNALHGAGLGLYGLRAFPLIGREPHRDLLWDALVRCAQSGWGRVVILEGRAGTGKSRLARWLCERAHELGAAELFKAVHTPQGGPADGLGAMVARALRCGGLETDEALKRNARTLRAMGATDPSEWELLTEIALNTSSQKGLGSQVRHAAIRRLLTRSAESRPAVIWLDDVQWGTEALWFAQELLASQQLEAVPALLILTVQTEALAERPAAATLVESLKDKQDVATLEVANLSPGQTEDLVSALLGLEHEVAQRLVKQSGGNPLFAVQLIEDWVSQGLLDGGAGGIGFREGVSPEVPGSLHAMWQGRLERFLAGQRGDDREALELAAALGVEIHTAEWERLCALASVSPSATLVDRLVQQRLAAWNEDGWSFVHGQLREAIEEMTKGAGRHRRHHAQCAAMLSDEAHAGEADVRGLHGRIGVHLLKAARFSDAFEELAAGADERRKQGDWVIMEELVDLAEYALSSAGVGDDDPKWGRTTVLRAWSLRRRGRTERTFEELAKILDLSPRPGWTEHELWALWLQAAVWMAVDRISEAESVYHQMADHAAKSKVRWAKARAQHGLGEVAYYRGEMERAAEHYRSAYRLSVQLGDRRTLAEAFKGRAEVAFAQNRPDDAAELFEEARLIFEELGDSSRLATVLMGVAEVERLRGHLDEAEAHYRELLTLFELRGSSHVGVTLCNIGLVRLARRDFPGAKMMLEQALVAFRRLGARSMEGGACAELLPCAASEGNWSAWDRYFARALKLISETNGADPDDAWPIQMAADMARAAGEEARARDAYEFALKLWTQLGRQTEIDQVRAALSATPH